jgi:hypothetical protein
MGRCVEINLVPQNVDLALYAGDGATLRLVVTDLDGAAVPLDGAVTAQIRVSRTAPTSVVAFAVDMTQGAQGIITLSLTGIQTASLIVGGVSFDGVWDVEWDGATREPVTLLQGKVECDLDVTH